MAVPANPKLSQVIAEFLAPAGTRLSQFLRGGAYVPDSPPNVAVPTVLPIKLSQLAGSVRYIPHSATNAPASSDVDGDRPGTIEDFITCNPVNGTGPFTYAWTASVSQTGFSIASPTAKTTRISRNQPGTTGGDVTMTGTLTCVSTDTGSGDGHQATSITTIDWLWLG